MMGGVAFIFPGQGAQRSGMARDVYERFPAARRVFEEASDVLGYSMQELCFEPNDRLDLTAYTQPALLTASIALLEAFRCVASVASPRAHRPDAAAGLSLGEYSALVCAGSLDLATAVDIVALRGRLMQDACPPGVGAMSTVLGLGPEAVAAACAAAEADGAGVVVPANYNCPGQIVISGDARAVERASAIAMELGARRVIPLRVSGPFHSPLLASAREGLTEKLVSVEISAPTVPVFSNVTAEPASDPREIRSLLGDQVCSPVRWEQSITNMASTAGIDTFVEFGPGRTLQGLVKRILPSATTYCVEDIASLEEAANTLF